MPKKSPEIKSAVAEKPPELLPAESMAQSADGLHPEKWYELGEAWDWNRIWENLYFGV